MVEQGGQGLHLTDLDTRTLLTIVHLGPSAVYRGTVRLLTPFPVHMCPDTADRLADEIKRIAQYVRNGYRMEMPEGE